MGKSNESFLCGDETGGLVVDYGSWGVKCGFAGEDLPKSDQFAEIGVPLKGNSSEKSPNFYTGISSLGANLSKLEIRNGVSMEMNRFVYDLDVVEANLDFCFEDVLSTKLVNHPFLWSTHSTVSLKDKAELTSYFLEKRQVPAFYPAPTSMLEAFSVGKQTALVVSLGHSAASFEAIHEGFRLSSSFLCLENEFCGTALNDRVSPLLEGGKPNDFSRFFSKDFNKSLSSSVKQWKKTSIVHDFKISYFRVFTEEYSEEMTKEFEAEIYELPDKSTVTLSEQRFQPAESFFNPSFTVSKPKKKRGKKKAVEVQPALQDRVLETLLKCHPDLRKDLAYNIVVTGGTATLPGLVERLGNEMNQICSTLMKPRLISYPETCQRHYASWIGGSVLASLGTFQQMWLSKQELDEFGCENVLLNKCLQ